MLHEELENNSLGFKKKHGTVELINLLLPRQQIARQESQSFYHRILEEKYSIIPRESSGHSPSFLLVDEKSKEPFAILKQSTPEFYCSFKKFLPEMPLHAAVWEHELIGFEIDRLFRFNHVPITLVTRFLLDDQPVNGTIQEYLVGSQDGSTFYHPDGARKLKALPKKHVHQLALSGFFKGLSGAQMSNYLILGQTIYEIDLETLLMPYNRLAEAPHLAGSKDLPTKESLNSLILCRMWILGLPQCDLAFDDDVLQPMRDPNILKMLQEYQAEAMTYARITPESWQAQLARVAKMQERMKQGPLTPRDLYFVLFGGEHLWKIAKEKRYPAMMAFNNFISDPYQHIVKDFSNLQDIPICKRLEEPKENTSESIDTMNFFRIMEGLSPLN